MIEELVKIHDKNSAELKVGFVARKKKEHNNFFMNIWMFIPNSLDINRFTYSKTDFYRDMKSNIRLITPVYILRDIAEGDQSAFHFLERSFRNLASTPTRTNQADFEYQVKMFLSILKSSLREEAGHIGQAEEGDLDYLVYNYCQYTKRIAERYRELYKIINVPTVDPSMMRVYRLGDEFMSNTIEYHSFRLLQGLREKNERYLEEYGPALRTVTDGEIGYKRERQYPLASREEPKANNKLIYRLSMLKKFAESHLFLNIDKRKDGVLAEQMLYSLAAGISMIFATVVAFSVQRQYGNFTMPLFVALVVSYMLKDRIKDFIRYYFAHKVGSRYFDHKISINMHDTDIGWARESMDFISEAKVPADIRKCRNRTTLPETNNPAAREKVLLYKTRMYINRKKLDATNDHPIAGVNSIIRFNMLQLMRNMDNAEFPLYLPEGKEGFRIIHGERLYHLNLVIQKMNDEQNDLQRYRISISRKGIEQIEKL